MNKISKQIIVAKHVHTYLGEVAGKGRRARLIRFFFLNINPKKNFTNLKALKNFDSLIKF